MEKEIIEFVVWITGHDWGTIEQMYKDWKKSKQSIKE